MELRTKVWQSSCRKVAVNASSSLPTSPPLVSSLLPSLKLRTQDQKNVAPVLDNIPFLTLLVHKCIQQTFIASQAHTLLSALTDILYCTFIEPFVKGKSLVLFFPLQLILHLFYWSLSVYVCVSLPPPNSISLKEGVHCLSSTALTCYQFKPNPKLPGP